MVDKVRLGCAAPQGYSVPSLVRDPRIESVLITYRDTTRSKSSVACRT